MFFMNSPTSPMVRAPKLSAATTVLALVEARRSMMALAWPSRRATIVIASTSPSLAA
jgi:hypothetical protein